jgi:alkanesulfonate monooxygenase SsuD/methylene tetrahydromethanopterin reductase-like flavin-dependent oxidoreductase (luciferase family)
VTGLERIGVYVWPWGATPPTVGSIAEQAAHAERLGFDSVHIGCHTTLPTSWIYAGFGNRSIVDQLVVLPVIVERTAHVRVALNAAPLPTRHPFLWAQYLASLDVHSGGRTIAGLAAGWWTDDFRIGGASQAERGARMDEALDVVTRLWAGEAITEPGRFWDAVGLALDPRPLQQPLPVWVGGSERSLERAARFGSAWMPVFKSPASLRDLRTKLDKAAARHGRRVELAVMTCAVVSDDDGYLEREARPKLLELASFDGPPEDPEACVVCGSSESCAEQVRRLFEAGADYVVLDFQLFGLESEARAREQMSRFAEASGKSTLL